jgi:uncharacterized integral membrane protein
MKLPVFLIGAIVLIVFAIVATTNAALTFIGSISWATWLCAALLSVFTHFLLGWDLLDLPVSTRRREQAPPAPPAP